MLKFFDNAATTVGTVLNALPGASIQVLNYPALTPATIFAINDTLSTPIPNATVIANQQGYFEWFWPSGTYNIVVSYGGIVAKTVTQIVVQDNGTVPAANVIYTPTYTNSVARTQASKDAELVTSYDFMTPAQIADVTSNAPAGDYTAVLQNLFNVTSVPVYVMPGVYPTSGALTRGTSTAARAEPIYMQPGASIKPSGSGYTALTIYPQPFTAGWSVLVDTQAANLAARPALNGLHIDNSAGSQWSLIRVYGCNGYGAKIDRMWDSTCDNVSVELCGNSTNYAFSMNTVNAGADTCNETHIVRLQVEQSDTLAINFDALTLNVRASLVHSERTYANGAAATDTWFFGGGNCYYGNLRLTTATAAAHDGNALAVFSCEHGTYDNVRMEQAGGTTVKIETRVNGSTAVLRNINTPVLQFGAGQNSPLRIYNADVATAYMYDTYESCWIGGTIGSLVLTPAGNPVGRNTANLSVYESVVITALNQTSNPCATFKNCSMGTIGAGGFMVFDACTFLSNLSLAFVFFEARNCGFAGNVAVDSTVGANRLINCEIAGTLSTLTVHNNLVNINSRVVGAVTAALNTAPDSGAWVVGERTYRITPVVGQPKSWACTVSGTPGTWVSEGNL